MNLSGHFLNESRLVLLGLAEDVEDLVGQDVLRVLVGVHNSGSDLGTQPVLVLHHLLNRRFRIRAFILRERIPLLDERSARDSGREVGADVVQVASES